MLGARQRRDALRYAATSEHLNDRQRAILRPQLLQDHAFKRVVVLGQDEMAEALPDLGDNRRELRLDVGVIGAAHGHLGLELRVMGAESELGTAVWYQRLEAFEQRIDMAFAEAIAMKALQADRRRRAAAGNKARDDL